MIENSKLFNDLKSEILKIFTDKNIATDPAHSINTYEWLKKIDQNASEELQIAALAHDIDRAIDPIIIQEKNESYDNYKARHALRSSKLITDLMIKHRYSQKSVEKTSLFVKNHEIGGDNDTNILTDADSISYFDTNIDWYYEIKGPEKTKDKIIFMYQRVSPRAKKIIISLKFKNPEIQSIFKKCLSEIR
ncbi:MAG: DUF4202 family protein [Candidatus Shapirobacteria bacterium]|nr:DUF4202 family protein [Candidatus Shapirobacteria bacterium]